MLQVRIARVEARIFLQKHETAKSDARAVFYWKRWLLHLQRFRFQLEVQRLDASRRIRRLLPVPRKEAQCAAAASVGDETGSVGPPGAARG